MLAITEFEADSSQCHLNFNISNPSSITIIILFPLLVQLKHHFSNTDCRWQSALNANAAYDAKLCGVWLKLGAVGLASSSYPLACGRAPCWRCAATRCWTPADAATRAPVSPERCAPREPGTSGPGGGSGWRRAPPAGRSRYCAESSSPGWRAAPRPSRQGTEATQSAGTSSPGTETDVERQEKTTSIRVTHWLIDWLTDLFICLSVNQ